MLFFSHCRLFIYHLHILYLKKYSPETFGATDFKYVDNLPDNQLLKGLKVWPVTEIVTYGFEAKDAPLNARGDHTLYFAVYCFV